MYVCSCFGITEQQVKQHAEAGAQTPRKIASACKAGTDCGNCVRRIQALLGRGACPRRELIDQGVPAAAALAPEPAAALEALPDPAALPAPLYAHAAPPAPLDAAA